MLQKDFSNLAAVIVGGLNPIVDFLLQEKLLAPKQVEYATRVRTKLETPRPLLEVVKELKLIACLLYTSPSPRN